MYVPLSLNVTATLTFDLETPNSIGHLLVMTNHHTKLEDHWTTSSLVIDRTRFVDGPTILPTDMCKAIYPLFFEGEGGGIII